MCCMPSTSARKTTLRWMYRPGGEAEHHLGLVCYLGAVAALPPLPEIYHGAPGILDRDPRQFGRNDKVLPRTIDHSPTIQPLDGRIPEDRCQKEEDMTLAKKVSLDKTPHARRPGPDEPVPSRYALRVGELEVLVISDGVFSLPATTLATNADPADLAAWLDERFQRPDVYKWPLNVVVVRSGGRTVLIDTGVGAEFPDAPEVGRLAARLDAAGIDSASVTDVVLTHLHVDHVGGLLAGGLKARLRPDVPIHVAAAEVEFWAKPDFSHNTFGGFPDVLQS